MARDTVVLLHGFMGSSLDWDPLTACLEDDYHCLAVDLPGHGMSRDVDLPRLGYEEIGAVLMDTLRRANVHRPHLLGYSLGGRLALHLAMRHPDAFASLILESTSPGLDENLPRERRLAVDEEHARTIERVPFMDWLRTWYRQLLFADLAKDPAVLESVLQRRAENDPAMMARYLREMSPGRLPSLWEGLGHIDLPVLVIVGGLDAKYVERAERMKASLGRCRVASIDAAGHAVHLLHSARMAEVIRSFLNEGV